MTSHQYQRRAEKGKGKREKHKTSKSPKSPKADEEEQEEGEEAERGDDEERVFETPKSNFSHLFHQRSHNRKKKGKVYTIRTSRLSPFSFF